MFTTFYHFLLLIIGFSLVIFLHELGHFLVAKRVGIRCDQFAIGFGNALVAWRKGIGFRVGSTTPEYEQRIKDGASPDSLGETEYRLNYFPLGGYVKMLGQDDLDQAHTADDPRSYSMQSVGARMAVISAGVIVNLISAFLLFVVSFMWGISISPPIVGQVDPNGIAASAAPIISDAAQDTSQQQTLKPGLRPGDRILEIDGKPVRRFADIQIASAMAKSYDVLKFVVDRNGKNLQFNLTPKKDSETGMMMIGIAPTASTRIAPITGADAQTIFDLGLQYLGEGREKLRPGMVLTSVNGQPVSRYWQLRPMVDAYTHGSPFMLEFSDPENAEQPSLELSAMPIPDLPASENGEPHLLGFSPAIRVSTMPPARKSNAAKAGMKVGDLIAQIGSIHWPHQQQLRDYVGARRGEEIDFVVLRDDKPVAMKVRASNKGQVGVYMSSAFDVMRVSTIEKEGPVVPRSSTSSNQLSSSSSFSDSGESTRSKSNPKTGSNHWAACDIFPPIPPGSRIVAVNGSPVSNWRDFRHQLVSVTDPGTETDSVVILRVALALPDSPTEEINWLIPHQQVELLHKLKWTLPLFFFAVEREILQASNPVQAISYGLDETWRMLAMTYLTLDRVARGTVDAKNLKGPVGIVQIGTQVSKQGLPELLMFLAIISVNLAVLNFLPIPILDGGQFLFLLIEKLKGSPVSPAVQDFATLAGLVILGGIFLFVTFNDLTNLFKGLV